MKACRATGGPIIAGILIIVTNEDIVAPYGHNLNSENREILRDGEESWELEWILDVLYIS